MWSALHFTKRKSTVKIKIIILTLLVLIGSVAHAQIGTSVVTAAAAFTVASTDTITIKAQIVSCGTGQLPLYNSLPISLTPNQTPAAPFTASNTGSAQSVTFTVPGNDAIVCGGQNYSLYALTWYDNGFPLAPTQTFRFIDNTTQTLSNLVSINFIPPVIGNSAGALCPAATPIFTGFTSNYQIQCAANSPSSVAALPITGGTLQGNLTVPTPYLTTLDSVKERLVNSIPQADQFTGADACIKVRAAAVYALANGINQVDATHFSGAQTCSVDMLGGLAAITTPISLLVNFGVVHFNSTVDQTISNSNITVRGAGRLKTIIEYTGTAAPSDGSGAALFIHAQSSGVTAGLTDVEVSDIGVLGNSHITDTIIVKDANRSKFFNIFGWGASNDGFHSEGNVTTTFNNIKISNVDATLMGWWNDGIHPTPVNGLDFDKSFASGNQTTDSTVTDAAAEAVSGSGWLLSSAASMTFTSGTVEFASRGINIPTGSLSKWNTFISPDLEGNTLNASGVDVLDNGGSNMYINAIMASPSAGTSAVFGGSGGQWIWGDVDILHGFSGNVQVLGNNIDFRQGSSFNFAGATLSGSLTLTAGSIGAANGFVLMRTLDVNTNITNDKGLQLYSGASCAATVGAIGNFCVNTITLPVAEIDPGYKPVCQAGSGGTGVWTVGALTGLTTTTFQVPSVTLSTTANTSGGTINCYVMHP